MDAFRALADPTRRRLVELVSAEPRTVGELTRRVSVSQPTVSKHLKALRSAGLVTVTAEGNRRWYRAKPEGIAEVTEWLEKYAVFWGKGVERLQRLMLDSGATGSR